MKLRPVFEEGRSVIKNLGSEGPILIFFVSSDQLYVCQRFHFPDMLRTGNKTRFIV